MALKSMAYDDAAYKAVLPLGYHVSGSGGTGKFVAFTDMLVKSINIKPFTAGTSNDVITAYKLSGTTTTTQVVGTAGSASQTAIQLLSTFTLALGDALSIVKGTDATAIHAVGVELAIIPGASVTA